MRGISAAGTGALRKHAMLAGALALALGMSACGSVDNALFGSSGPSAEQTAQDRGLAGTLPGAGTQTRSSSQITAGTLPISGATATGVNITPVPIEGGTDTGTAVNKKIQQLRNEMADMQDKLVANAQRLSDLRGSAVASATAYHQSKAQITTRLQVGTTRGNPELVGEWNQAQSALDQMSGNINAMNALGTDIANNSSRAHYVLDTIQATFNVSGAVDEDHRQLSVLQDETNQTIVLIDKLLSEVSADVQRQTAYVANERANLTTLASAIKNGELYGADLGTSMLPGPTQASYTGGGSGNALVTIRFDQPNVEYQQILYTALNQALQAQPGASFSVVAVSPTRGTAAAVQLAQTAAKRHAQEVMRSMTDMGVPATRLAVSSTTDPGARSSEVRVFVR